MRDHLNWMSLEKKEKIQNVGFFSPFRSFLVNLIELDKIDRFFKGNETNFKRLPLTLPTSFSLKDIKLVIKGKVFSDFFPF